MSYDHANGVGHINALSPNSAYRNLVLQYAGGNVGIGASSPTAKLQVAGGDAAITNQGSGLILRASDGPKCFRVTVNNVGTLSMAEVTCP